MRRTRRTRRTRLLLALPQHMRDQGKPTAILTAILTSYAHGQAHHATRDGKTVASATNSATQQTAPEAAGAAPNAGALVAPKPAALVPPKAPKPPVAARVLPKEGTLLGAAAGAPTPPLLVPKAGAAKPQLLETARDIDVVASLVTPPTSRALEGGRGGRRRRPRAGWSTGHDACHDPDREARGYTHVRTHTHTHTHNPYTPAPVPPKAPAAAAPKGPVAGASTGLSEDCTLGCPVGTHSGHFPHAT